MLTRYKLMKNYELLQVGDFLHYYPVGSTNTTGGSDLTYTIGERGVNHLSVMSWTLL